MPNLFSATPGAWPEEIVEELARGAQARIERIISQGHASPPGFWYDQELAEWVVVLQGAARIRFEDRELELRPGDYLNIAAHEKHRVEWTASDTPTIWLAVHYRE